jgi:sodium transport system ATP-binding protein
MIEVKNLSKTFELSRKQRKELNTTETEFKALQNVSFTCHPGRVFSLLGPNGAGKTTTLRTIGGILKPTSGSVVVSGIDLEKNPNEARKKIGFLTGSTGLYGRLTPNELIAYFAGLYGMDKTTMELRKKWLFDLLDMNFYANKQIGKLSTGMKQKVSICRTMIHDPDVLVFDEPTSGLDVISAEAIINLVRSCKEQNKTVIFSSHIMSEVELLCDDLAIIHKGKIIEQSSFQDFKNSAPNQSLTERFIEIIKKSEEA